MPAELVPLMESNAPSINMDDTDLVRHMVPGMIDEDNQPLPENIPTATEQQNTSCTTTPLMITTINNTHQSV